jgi:hypothetical protein
MGTLICVVLYLERRLRSATMVGYTGMQVGPQLPPGAVVERNTPLGGHISPYPTSE